MPAKCLAMDGELLAQRKYEPTKKSNVVQQPGWIVRNSSLLVFANNCRRCRALILEFLRLRQWDQRVPCPAVWIVCKNIQTVIFDERIWVLSAAEIWALCIDIASEHLGMWPVFWRASLSLQFPSGSAIASKFVVVRFVRAFAFLCAVDAHQNLPRSQKKYTNPMRTMVACFGNFPLVWTLNHCPHERMVAGTSLGANLQAKLNCLVLNLTCLVWGMQAPAKADSTVWLWPFDHPTHISST